MVHTAGIAELKAKLSEHVAFVERGDEVVITVRGRPVARISRIEPAETEEEARLQRLAARGGIKLRRGWSAEEAAAFLARPKVKVPKGVLLRALLEDREEGG